jgi:hypothetical protein
MSWVGEICERECGRQGSRTEAGDEEGIPAGRVAMSMHKSHEVSKAEKHHDVHTKPGLIEGSSSVGGGGRGGRSTFGIWR